MMRIVILSWITIGAAVLLAGCEQAAVNASKSTTAATQPANETDKTPLKSSGTGSESEDAPLKSRGTETPADVPAGTKLTTSDGGYWVHYVSDPDPIPLNELVSFTVTVRPCYDPAAEGVTLRVDAAMPDHGHGMNTEPRVTPLGDGRFLAEGLLLHMAGYWEVYFDVTRAGVTERAQFDLELE